MKFVCIGIFVCMVLAYAAFAVNSTRLWYHARGELRRRELKRLYKTNILYHPGAGFQMVDQCICERDGQEYHVVIMNEGLFRKRLHIDVDVCECEPEEKSDDHAM